MKPDITYLIMDYNPFDNNQAAQWFDELIESMRFNCDPTIRADVLLISQGNSDKREELLQKKCRSLGWKCLLLPKNVGISRGINIGLHMARSPYFGIISSDVMVTHGMDINLLSEFGDNSIYATIPFSDKSELPYQEFKPEESFGNATVNMSETLKSHRVIAYELSVLFLRTAIRDHVGYFDERWKACYENLDYGLRTHLAGFKTLVSKKAFAWHRHGGCIKSGARNLTYDDYINMPGGFDQSKLVPLWHNKWTDINSYIDIYNPLDTAKPIEGIREKFGRNIYLGYEQDVGY